MQCHRSVTVNSNGFLVHLDSLDRRHQNIVVRPENCLQLWTQKCGCFGHLCTEQCQCRLPMDIANADCQCRAISEVQVFRFKRFLSECCSFNQKSKALQASPSTLAALPVRGFLGPKTVQVAGSQVMWYLRFFS